MKTEKLKKREKYETEDMFVNPGAYEDQEHLKFTPEVRRQWADIQEYGANDEEQQIRLIKNTLLMNIQKDVLYDVNLDISDLLNGRYSIQATDKVIGAFYKPWNEILKANDLKPEFNETNDTVGMLQAIGDMAAPFGINQIQLGDGPPINLPRPNPGRPAPEPEVSVVERDDFWANKATLPQLKKQAKFLGIKGFSKYNKADLTTEVLKVRRENREKNG